MKNIKQKYGPWALVTGASSGIGKEMATQLAKLGLNLILVARREPLLSDLKVTLENNYNVRVKAITLDLSKEGAVKELNALTSNFDIGLVIPNAGTETTGEFVDTDLNINTNLLYLNTLVPMQITNVFGARLKARGAGGLLLTSSLFGYQGIPYVANYSATKAYILSLGEALNFELKPYGVDVSVLSPGLTATEMSKNMSINFNKIPILSMNAEKTAKIGLKALGRKVTVVPGFLNKLYAWENRFIPRSWPVALFGFLISRAILVDEEASYKQKLVGTQNLG